RERRLPLGRHCEEHLRRSNPALLCFWIASRSLSSGARSRDPLVRNDVRHSPFHLQALSRSCICAGAGATTRTGSLFLEIGITSSRECRCSRGSPKRGPLP